MASVPAQLGGAGHAGRRPLSVLDDANGLRAENTLGLSLGIISQEDLGPNPEQGESSGGPVAPHAGLPS